MAYSDEFVLNLERLALIYIKECCSHQKEQVTNKGDIILVQDRHIPTIDYFLRIWIPIIREEKGFVPSTWYAWLNGEDKLKSETIKKIDKARLLGYNVCIWPDSIEEKDVNDMVKAGMSADYIKHVIDKNTYRELSAKMALTAWSKA